MLAGRNHPAARLSEVPYSESGSGGGQGQILGTGFVIETRLMAESTPSRRLTSMYPALTRPAVGPAVLTRRRSLIITAAEVDGAINDACGIQRLPTGNTLIATYRIGKGGERLLEVSPEKKIV